MGAYHILKKEVVVFLSERHWNIGKSSMVKKKEVNFVLNLPWPYLTQNEAKK